MKTFFVAIAVSVAGLSPAASADQLNFSLSGTNGRSASWSLASTTQPSASINNFVSAFANVDVNVDGIVSGRNLQFYTQGSGGGFDIFSRADSDVIYTIGTSVISGPTSNPTFLTGTFLLDDNNGQPVTWTLSIVREASAAVPESATWVMMISGIGVLGGLASPQRSSHQQISCCLI